MRPEWRFIKRVTFLVATLSGLSPLADELGATTLGQPPAGRDLPSADSDLAGPHHGSSEGLSYGGDGELRFAEDREAGVSDPGWFSVGRVNAFAIARLSRRFEVAGRGGYDRGSDDFTLERAEVHYHVSLTLDLHGGIFLAPLGRSNTLRDAPARELSDLSLVATQLIGAPYAELGIGVRGKTRVGKVPAVYELDLVSGYGEGLVLDASGGTRLAAGRNNYGDDNGLPALAARLALAPSSDMEIGLSGQSGPYNRTEIGGVRVDDQRYVHLIVVDAASRIAGCSASTEAAMALIDVPPALEDLYAQWQWGAAVEVSRSLLDPISGALRGSSLRAALRLDAVDLDRAVAGDSRARLSASLNVRPRATFVTRFGWYYEIRRDRFDNATRLAGLTLTLASYF